MHSEIESQLAAMIDRERAEREQEYCADELSLCDLCAVNLAGERFVIDGGVTNTRQAILPSGETMSQWAYMCSRCFVTRGQGIRWGQGQLYEQIFPGRWLRVAGGPIGAEDE